VKGEWVAIDGSKFQAVSSAKSVREREALERYLEQLEQSDEQDEVVIDSSAVASALEKLRQHPEPDVGCMRTTHGLLPAYHVQAAVDAEHALIVVQQVTDHAADNRSLQPMAEAAQAVPGGPGQPINVVADAGYSNGEQAEACEASGILPHVSANRGANNHGDGTLFDRSEFTYQSESDTLLCPAGQTLTRKQLSRKDRAVLYAAQPEVLLSVSSEIALHRIAATDDYPSPPRRSAAAHATAGHAGGYATATINRGTSIRQFEIPHLRTSTLPAAWTAGSANGNQPGSSRLQSKKNAKHSRRTQTDFSTTNHLKQPNSGKKPQRNKKRCSGTQSHRFRPNLAACFVTVWQGRLFLWSAAAMLPLFRSPLLNPPFV
jgi:hypothetical protein